MKKSLLKLTLTLSMMLILSACDPKNGDDSAAQPQGDVILEQAINVGSTPAVFTVANKISVTIPPGAVTNGSTLKIEEVQLSNAPQDATLTLHKVYNVSISSGSQFTTPLEITLFYDASKIPSGTQFTTIGASYFSTGLQRWNSFQDVLVDKTTNKVTFKTNHLTTLSVWHRQYAYGYTNYLSSAHFNVYWKNGEPMSNAVYPTPFTSHANATDPYYIQDLLTYLETAYTGYKNANFWVPTWSKVDVYVKNLGSVDGNSSFFGYLNINKKMDAGGTLRITDVLQQTAAHEFLHYIQDYYYIQLFSDYTNKWWLEATATLGDHIVNTGKSSYEGDEWANGTIQAQLENSWDDCNSDPEYYKAGGFLSFIGYYRTGQKANLPALIREGGNKFNLNNFRTIVDNYNATNLPGWKGIGTEYSDYIIWAVGNRESIKIPIMPIISTNDKWVKPVTLAILGFQNVSVTIPHMAAAMVKIRNTSTTYSTVSILATNMPSGISNSLFSSSSNSINAYYSNLKTGDSITTYLYSATTWKDYLLVNTSKDNDLSVSLRIRLNPQSSGCVMKGTLVMLEDGSTKPIEQIRPKDKIVAYDTILNKITKATVVDLLIHRDKKYSIDNLKFANNTDIKITGNHPVLVKNKGWVKVDDLIPGDVVYHYDKLDRKFSDLKVVSIIKDVSTSDVVFNLKTTQGNYIANDVLIHNKCLKKGSLIETPTGSKLIEEIRPGMEVYGFVNGNRIKTHVTNTYTKSTILDYIPGKKLDDGTEVTINHQVYYHGKFINASELPVKNVEIRGNVYDIRTETGNYYSNGYLMR